MKKLTKKSLDELAQQIPVISKLDQRWYVGGGNGSKENPYTVEEFDYLSEIGLWTEGYVEGWGYTGSETTIIASGTSNGGSDSGNWTNPDIDSDNSSSGTWGGSGSWGSGDWSSGNWGINPNGNQTDNGYTGGGSSTGGSGGSNNRNPLTDGIDLSKSQCILINISSSSTFYKQLIQILQSNSVLSNIMSYFVNGCTAITFTVADLNNPNVIASTHINPDGNSLILFNKVFVDKDGWQKNNMGRDATGFDWGQVKTKEQGLLVTAVHEALHASHYARYKDALRIVGGDADKAAKWLLDNQYSKEFVEIFFKKNDSGEWTKVANDGGLEDRMHAYMNKYDLGVMNKALEEYQNEHK